MAKTNLNMSIREYAKTLGISHQAILKAINSGKIKNGVSYLNKTRNGKEFKEKQINPVIADKEWGNLHKSGKIKPGQKALKAVTEKAVTKNIKKLPLIDEEEILDDDNDLVLASMKITKDLTFAEAARKREIIGLVMDKIKSQELTGVLVRQTDVDRELFSIGVELKKSLLNIPARVTADVRAAANDVEAQTIFTIELNQILSDFSKKISPSI